ncbi:ChrR family anti-sigma-E factor [Gilvimarinus polysaccharolyticus]|uniref:ChrR family anti-sigma-E factor n=1 Tax=Gilvimarinus polysaccharolyticus TaxID=863921 RepID=UPI0006730BBD|nr:ChrR family anti-sigma-E factor [Gilvimarinus polysaccharolyticus]
MTITQHPSSDWLSAYAAGTLPLGQSLCVATHLEFCHQCRQNYSRLNQLGGELMQTLTPVPSAKLSLDELMARIEAQPAAPKQDIEAEGVTLSGAAATSPTKHPTAGVPRSLRKLIPAGYQKLKWSRISPSIRAAELCRDNSGLKVELLRIKPGGATPTHTHLGDELTLILQGSFSDEEGVYHAGDFMSCDQSDTHTPVASVDRECICLTVTQAPIQLTGFFGRWLNPLLRRGYTSH